MEIDELMILTDDQIDYTGLSSDTLKELALGEELFMATSALVQLATINKYLAAAVAEDILSNSKGDRYLQATAIETLFGLDKRRAIEYIMQALPEECDSYILNAIADLVIENRSDFQYGMGGRVFSLLWSKMKSSKAEEIDRTVINSFLKLYNEREIALEKRLDENEQISTFPIT